MTQRKVILAVVAAGLAAAACASDPAYTSSYSEPRYVGASAPVLDEGRIVAIDVVRGPARTSGAGAVVGGIVGGVVGHQFGNGRGNDAATVAGAVGGAVAGNEIERRRDADEQYRVAVQTRDGREATFVQDSLNGLRVGDRVRIDGNRLFRD